MRTAKKILDYILLGVIFLSIIQIVVDDLGLILNWGNQFHVWMVVLGFAFDFIFTTEFTVRSISAIRKGKFWHYIKHEKGWIDFLASIPLLLLNSGPMLFMLITGGGSEGERSVANLLKVIRAVRISRILRVLRVLKIFSHIENVHSKMSQHHVSYIAAIMVLFTLLTYFVLNLTGFVHFTDVATEAKLSLLITSVLIVNVAALATLYAGHFSHTVSDPLYVVKRGLKEKTYGFTAKVLEHYKDHEVFELADIYNRQWLPFKLRVLAGEKRKKEKSPITEDYSDLL